MTFGRDETATAARKRVLEVLDDGEPHAVGDVVDGVRRYRRNVPARRSL